MPQNESWGEMIESCFPEAVKEVRYAIKKDTHFSREKLKKMAASLPDNYLIRRINPEIYDMCLENSIFKDCVCHFGSKEAFLEAGRGFAVMKDGRLVSACSSYTRYREGFELEVDTVKEERRKGLAGAVSAAMILSCISDGLYPSWDAMNMESVHLAEKLGYEFSHEYTCYWVEQR